MAQAAAFRNRLPRGFGLGLLEGWEQIVVDGDPSTALSGTGAEDYFSGGFYFLGGPFCTPTYGCTHRSFFTGRVSAYRLHVHDPIHFHKSIQVALDHGLANSLTGDYSSVAYWYQREPHTPFPPLPNVAERSVSLASTNPVQWLALIALLVLLVVGAYMATSRKLERIATPPSGFRLPSRVAELPVPRAFHDTLHVRAPEIPLREERVVRPAQQPKIFDRGRSTQRKGVFVMDSSPARSEHLRPLASSNVQRASSRCHTVLRTPAGT